MNQEENKKEEVKQEAIQKIKPLVDKPIAIVCIVLLAVFVLILCTHPDQTLNVVNVIYDKVTAVVGPMVLWFAFIGLFFCVYLAFSKHGKVKLGDGEPQYSTFSYVGMMLCASLAATAIFYSFVEWSYYYADPAFGIEPYSTEAAEMSITYTFFHWGFACQAIFVMAAVSMAYAYYVKKIPVLRIGAVCEAMMGNFKYKKPLAKIIDALAIISITGGLGVSLGVGIPLVTAGLGAIFGLEANFITNLIVLIIIAAIFTFTSFIGIDRGMKRLSDFTMYIAIFLIAFIFITGPTEFIWKELTFSLGEMIQNYTKMSLYTDPVLQSGFPEANTIFLFTLALNYAAMMGIFITKISKGRTIRSMILISMLGITGGIFIMFAINGGFGLNAELTGQYALTQAADVNTGLYELLGTLPGGKLFLPIILTVVTIGLLTTSMDSASFTLATSSTKRLDENGNPSRKFRIVWCVVLALIPLAIMYTDAPFSALKTICIVCSVPFMFIIIGMLIGLFKWFKEDGN